MGLINEIKKCQKSRDTAPLNDPMKYFPYQIKTRTYRKKESRTHYYFLEKSNFEGPENSEFFMRLA